MRLLTVASLLTLVSPQPLPDQEPDVGFGAVADVSWVAPGQVFHLAARITLPAHWHVYWENPGDSGMATTVTVEAPEGFEVGRPLFPGPERLALPEGVVVYGYETEVVVFVPVAAPEELAPDGDQRFTVSASWLVCKESCFLGGDDDVVVLGSRSAEPEPANEELLAAQRARLPRKWKELRGVETAWGGSADEPSLRFTVKGAHDLEIFPGPESRLRLDERELDVAEGETTLTARFRQPFGVEEPASKASGLLRVTTGGKTAFYEFALER